MHADNPHGNSNAQQTFNPIQPEYRFNSQAGAMPREIVRWLQNLDVTPNSLESQRPLRANKPIKHPKRDFANGYQVARVISLATEDVINMNNFDDVSSAARKVQNWKELQKQLRMANLPTFADQHIADVMAAKDGAADDMLLMIYQKFASRPPPGASAATKGGAPPGPQPLDRVPAFVRSTAARDDDAGAGAGGAHTNEATKQLSAMAAEQLRAAELELLKQKTDTDLRAEIIGLADGKQQQGGDSSKALGPDGQPLSQQQQQQKRYIPRAPAAPQPLVQGEIRAVDASAESQDKAVLFNTVSLRQLSGAALQRFGFRDRSQSPSARGAAGSLQGSPKSGRGGGAAGSAGRGGVGAAIHAHLCQLVDRFAADFFSVSTTWNPPADSSPLSYFIENCGNSAVITPSFKYSLWAYLTREAPGTAAVLASAPIDTLFFVSNFANVSLEESQQQQTPTTMGDAWTPKFFGADAMDSTLYCHAVLGALYKQKRAAAESILRRYALPALLPLMLQQHRSGSVASLRRGLFALSSLSIGDHQPPGVNAIASSLRYFVQQISNNNNNKKKKETHIAGDLETGALLSEQEQEQGVRSLQKLTEALHDGLVGNFDATVQFASKIFSAEELQQRLFADAAADTTSPPSAALQQPTPPGTAASASSRPTSSSSSSAAQKEGTTPSSSSSSTMASPLSRQVSFFRCCESLIDSLRGDVPPSRLHASDDAPVPAPVALLILGHVERCCCLLPPLPVEESGDAAAACRVAALRCLTSLARSGAVATVPEVGALVQAQLQSVLSPLLRQKKKKSNASSTENGIVTELIRLLCCTLRCTPRNDDDDESNHNAMLLQQLFINAGDDVLKGLHPEALLDAERLVLASAIASALSNFETPSSSSPPSAAATVENTTDEHDKKNKDDDHHEQKQQQQHDQNEKLYAETYNGLSNFCIDTLLALPPSALETFGFSGGNLSRAVPSIFAAASSSAAAAALGNPLDCSRWSMAALGRAINGRFLAHNSSSNNNSLAHKISAPAKTGSAGVLKLATPPTGFSSAPTAPEFAAFLRPYRAVLLLFTLCLARHTDVQQSSLVQAHRENDDTVAWWQMLSSGGGASSSSSASAATTGRGGAQQQQPLEDTASPATSPASPSLSAGSTAPTLGTELKKLLLYYDAARKGAAAVAPRTSNDAEAMHEVYVQAGRAALFIVIKVWQDLNASSQSSSTIPSQILPYVGLTLTALAGRVSMPASKAVEDDAALGQQGLEVAVKAMEWYIGVLGGKNTTTPAPAATTAPAQ